MVNGIEYITQKAETVRMSYPKMYVLAQIALIVGMFAISIFIGNVLGRYLFLAA